MLTIRQTERDYESIPGTFVFDGRMAMKGYALNKMCFSFNQAENREAYMRDPGAYCDRYGITAEQRSALQRKDVLDLLRSGANIYYLAKWAGIFSLSVQQLGAQQRGVSLDEFNAMLLKAGAR